MTVQSEFDFGLEILIELVALTRFSDLPQNSLVCSYLRSFIGNLLLFVRPLR